MHGYDCLQLLSVLVLVKKATRRAGVPAFGALGPGYASLSTGLEQQQ